MIAMPLFNKKKIIEVDGKKIELQKKPGLFSKNQKPTSSIVAPTIETKNEPFLKNTIQAQSNVQQNTTNQNPQQVASTVSNVKAPNNAKINPKKMQKRSKPIIASGYKVPKGVEKYVNKIAVKRGGLEAALRDNGIKETPQQFIKKMMLTSIIFAAIITIALLLLLSNFGLPLVAVVLLPLLIGFVVYQTSLTNFINYPLHRSKKSTKLIDRDILFAARDMIISLRSGMPLFNAITSVSSGYGEASKEFAKIVQRVQLGSPLIETIDEVMANTKSNSFKRLMLQASISIKSGADIVSAFQSTIDELTLERQIELRRYGQKLNALSMFYMLFGIIFPSMGIAVVTILTTFISIFTVTDTILYAVLIGIVFLQIVFINLISSSRPIFAG